MEGAPSMGAKFMLQRAFVLLSTLDTRNHLAFFSQTPGRHTQLNGLYTLELISHCRTVAAIGCMTPGNDGSIFKNRSKGKIRGFNLLHTLELISNCRTVTTRSCTTPGHDRSIFQNRSKGPHTSGLNLLHTPELILNCRTV